MTRNEAETNLEAQRECQSAWVLEWSAAGISPRSPAEMEDWREAWEQFRERIASMPLKDQWLKRLFLGNAMDVDMDGTGRILISPELRSATGISRETLLLGMGSHFELWDRGTYEARDAEALQAGLADAFQELSF